VVTSLEASGISRQERDIALCRSLLYEALALGFSPPTSQTCRRLGTDSAAAALSEAAAFLEGEEGMTLARRARSLAAPAGTPCLEELSTSYQDLFGHTARGPVPPYETEYGDDTLLQKPQEMADIAGFFRAFGLVPDPAARERFDHVACELEFLAFLSRKEAHALESGDAAMLEATRHATRLFLRDHLGRFAPAFAQRLRRENPGHFYGCLGDLLMEFVEAECRRFHAPSGSASLRLRIDLDDKAPILCGGAEGCLPGACDGAGAVEHGEEG